MDNFYWATGKYGRVAKRLPCFLRAIGIKPIGQLKSGRLAFGQLALMDHHVYWATKNNGREANALLLSGNWHHQCVTIGQLRTTTAGKRLPCFLRAIGIKPIGQLKSGCLAFGQLASMDHVY
jgi:hypothetical protein